ncbi:MAG: tetratricopeptide repeat protein [Elainellaceae cyanobacterium]
MNQWTHVNRNRVWMRIILIGLGSLSLSLGVLVAPMGLYLHPVYAQSMPAAVSRGYDLLNRGWVDDAIATFREAVRRYPDSLDAKLGLAIAYQRAGQDANAWAAYQQVVAQDPTNRQALTAIGLLGGYRLEWQAQGIEALTTLLGLDPDDLEARAQRALLLRYQGRFAESIADYEILLAENATPDIILEAAQSYVFSGAYERGLVLFEQYQDIARLPDRAIVAYALALRETGRAVEAVEILSARLRDRQQVDATTLEIRSALAVAYAANRQPDEAIATLDPLRSRGDSRLSLARSLSEIARQTGDQYLYDEAVDLYREILSQIETPSIGLLREAADVLSESPSAQADALQIYRQLLERQPDDISLRVKRSLLEYQLGDLSRTALVDQLQDIGRSLPDNSAELRAIALALVPFDSPDPALLPLYQQLVSELVAADSDVPFLYYRMAQMYLQQGDYGAARQALAEYEAAAYEQPNFSARLLQAEIERRSGDLNASARQYETLIASNPPAPILNDALRGLAGIRVAQGRLGTALELYDDLVARNPDTLAFQLGRASIAYRMGQISGSDAEAVLDNWLATQPPTALPPELYSLVGVLPPSPERESLYQRLLAADPDNLAVNLRQIQLLASRDPAQAQARVDQLISDNPDDINVYFVQGELAQQLDDLDQAADAYQAILNREPENPDALAALGGVRFEQRNYTEAERLYERVLTLKPDDLETRRILAELSAAQGEPLTALRRLEELQDEQDAQGISDPVLDDRIDRLQVDFLRRRGFQPYWERY